jgi:sugar lactone lactonase YvrE
VRDGEVIAIDTRGHGEVVHVIDGHTNGLGWDTDDNLLVVSMSNGRLLRAEGSELREYADVRALHGGSLNDMTVDSKGRAYISTLAADALVTPLDQLDAPSGLICVEADGSSRIEGGGLRFGNGLAITADGKTLLVAETFAGRISAFSRDDGGVLSDRRDWYVFDDRDSSDDHGGYWSTRPAPDGIAIDAEDAIWVADAGGHGAYRVAAGEGITDFVETGPLAVFAVALGGEEGHTLFMCAGPPLGNGQHDESIQCRVLTCTVDVGV